MGIFEGTLSRRPSRAGIALAAAASALTLTATAASAHAAVSFGSNLTPDVQPSNAESPHPCDMNDPSKVCTRVMGQAYGAPGNEGAPKNGTIHRIRLIAGAPGSFRLQIVKYKAGSQQAKLVRNGPVIHYQGQTPANDESGVYNVESFKVNVPVRKGQRLAIRSSSTSTLRCSSGGPNNLIYSPPLGLGSPFRAPTDEDGCWMLVQARY